MSRNYRKEYDDYHASPEQKKRRAARNAARRSAEAKGQVKKGDSKHVHHVGASRTGKLDNSRTKVMDGRANQRIQPKRGK